MKKLCKTVLILFLALPWLAHAASYKTETVQVTATGATEDKAIVKALGQAVQQANGSTVNVQSHIRDTDQGVVVDWMGNHTVIPSQEVNVGYTSSQAGGLIKSYKVISSQYLGDAKAWRVTISAEVAKYANVGADRSGLLQVAVLPFRTTDASYATVSGTIPSKDAARNFSDYMTNDFVQSGKFRILDRSYWEESDIEEQIVRERSYGNQESIKLGQKLGADYMIVGSIEDFDTTPTVLKMYGANSKVYETQFAIQVRVIEVATSDIIWSNSFNQSLDRDALNRKLQEMRKANPKKSESQLAKDLQAYIYQTVSNSLTTDIINRLTGSAAPATTGGQAPAPAREARPLTPGSSEKPLEWH